MVPKLPNKLEPEPVVEDSWEPPKSEEVGWSPSTEFFPNENALPVAGDPDPNKLPPSLDANEPNNEEPWVASPATERPWNAEVR